VRAQFPCIDHLSKEEFELKLMINALVMAVVCLALAGCGSASAVPVVEAAANSRQPSQTLQCTQLPTTTNAKGQRVFSYQCPNYPVFTFTEVKKR
jgi:hypothetical protein